jgi:hypothetical protein
MENGELELADDFDWANTFWESLTKGPEVGVQDGDRSTDTTVAPGSGGDTKAGESTLGDSSANGGDEQNSGSSSTENQEQGEVDANEHTGAEGKMATRSSDQEQQADQSGRHRADADGGDGDTRPSPPGGVTVHTVTPTSPDSYPSQPESTAKPNHRKGPKFKRHRWRREHSSA